MRQPELTRLRRERYAIQRALRPIERSLATHWARLAEVEAAILELDPVLDLATAPYRPVPIFARGELVRLALDMLRQTGRPLGMREMVLGALHMKGIRWPDRRTRLLTERRLQVVFRRYEGRGLVVRVGDGSEMRRRLIEQ